MQSPILSDMMETERGMTFGSVMQSAFEEGIGKERCHGSARLLLNRPSTFFLYSSFTQLRLRFAPGVDGTKLGIVENIISHRITITLDSVPSAATQCCVAPFILIQRLLHKGTSLGLVRVVRSNLSCPLSSVSSPGASVPWLMFHMPTCHWTNLAVFSTRNLPSTNSHSSTALSSLPLTYSLCFVTRCQNWCLYSLGATSA